MAADERIRKRKKGGMAADERGLTRISRNNDEHGQIVLRGFGPVWHGLIWR